MTPRSVFLLSACTICAASVTPAVTPAAHRTTTLDRSLRLRGGAAAAAALEVFGTDVGEAIRGAPGYVRKSLRQFRTGISGMWTNSKASGEVKKRLRQKGGAPATYSELVLLRKAGEDTGKLLQVGFLWLAAPEFVPALLYFSPRALPSTFESAEGRLKRYGTMGRLRVQAALDLFTKLEQEAATARGKKAVRAAEHAGVAAELLRAKSCDRALEPLRPYVEPSADEVAAAAAAAAKSKGKKKAPPKLNGRRALKGLNGPLLKASARLIGVSGPLPGKRGALGKHLVAVQSEDVALSRDGAVDALGRAELLEACYDRGLGASEASDAQLRAQLRLWLSLTEGAGGAKPSEEGLRLRLAALAACGIASARQSTELQLPRLLYTGRS